MRFHRASLPPAALLMCSLAASGCAEEDPAQSAPLPANPATTGAGGGGGEGGASASSSSSAEGGGGDAPVCHGPDPKPGCACETEGELWDCGQVYSKVGNQIVCGPGRMSCAGGVWGECVLSNIPL